MRQTYQETNCNDEFDLEVLEVTPAFHDDTVKSNVADLAKN